TLACRLVIGAQQRHLGRSGRPALRMVDRPDAAGEHEQQDSSADQHEAAARALPHENALTALARRFVIRGIAGHQRISSTGSTPKIFSPDATTNATACTKASRAMVSSGASDMMKRRPESSFPLFHKPWKAAASSWR